MARWVLVDIGHFPGHQALLPSSLDGLGENSMVLRLRATIAHAHLGNEHGLISWPHLVRLMAVGLALGLLRPPMASPDGLQQVVEGTRQHAGGARRRVDLRTTQTLWQGQHHLSVVR